MTLLFKGNKYDIAALAKKTGPTITIQNNELHPENGRLVEIKEGYTDLVTPLLVKYEGKYVVLTGHNALKDVLKEGLPITAKLLSNPVLKLALEK